MKKSILCFVLFFIIVDIAAQATILNKDSVFVYTIVDAEFETILDSFILHEKQYDYYDASVIFPITIDVYKNLTMIQLFSGHKNNDSIQIVKDHLIKMLVSYKQHLFVTTIRTNDSEQNLFKKTNSKQVVYFINPIKETNKTITLDEIFNEVDDYWMTTWIYQFKDGHFLEMWKSPLIDLKK